MRGLEEPTGFDVILDGEDVPPVDVKPEGKKRKKKAKATKKSQPDKKSPPSSSSKSPVTTRADILETFPDCYQGIIKKLPIYLWPCGTRHGQHSYTVRLGFCWLRWSFACWLAGLFVHGLFVDYLPRLLATSFIHQLFNS